MITYIDFFNVKPILHSWDKPFLIAVYYPLIYSQI